MSVTQLVHDSPGCSAVRLDGSGHVFFSYTVGFVLAADGVVCTLAATWMLCLHVGYVLIVGRVSVSGSVCDGDGLGTGRTCWSCE